MSNKQYYRQPYVEQMVDIILHYITINQKKLRSQKSEFSLNLERKPYWIGTDSCEAPTGVISIFNSTANEKIFSSADVLGFSEYYDRIIEDKPVGIAAGVSLSYLKDFCRFVFCFHETLKEKFDLAEEFVLKLTPLGFTLEPV